MKVETARIIGAITFSFICILGSVKLKEIGEITEPSFVIFALTSVFIGLFIAYSHRIEFLNLKNLEFKMCQVEKVRQDVISREENIKKISLLLCEITALESSIRGFGVSARANKIRKKWYRSKATQLLDAVKASDDEKNKTLKPLELFNDIFQEEIHDEDKIEEGWKKFWMYLEDDIATDK
ncbi:MAG: hypothetical protein D3922_14605 [Candidatus Electrothrix sp. AR1]|nr:hypothetical protein [Candidatus Electrothrix sp. AR1]